MHGGLHLSSNMIAADGYTRPKGLIVKYRSEIDGLRAVAVVPVIFFHAGFDIFQGGFVGVDIFFVISGYLITALLIDEFSTDQFSLASFYERRARRILPALFLIVCLSLPFAWHWMSPAQLDGFSKSVVAVVLFVSNFLFFSESGYFDIAAEEKPLLHTWSLAVEEQYYVLFPLLLFLIWPLGQRRVLWTVITLSICSFGLSEWASRHAISANFYLAPMRAWELFAGSISAFVIHRHGIHSSDQFAALGLAAITAAIFLYDSTTPFPGTYALLPVLGTVLIILFAGPGTLVAKILSLRVFVAIGLVSYSAYLWHQPLFAFTRIRMLEPPSSAFMVFLCGLTFLLAWLSWKFVETPFRDRNRVTRGMLVTLGLTCAAFLVVSGLFIRSEIKDREQTMLPPNLQWEHLGDKINSIGLPCDWSENVSFSEGVTGCIFGDTNASKNLVLLGDSHSQAISYVLDALAQENGLQVHWFRFRDCEPIPGVFKNRNVSIEGCEAAFQDLLTYIASLDADIIVLNRWTFRMYPVEGYNLDMPYKNSEGFEEVEDYREYDVFVNRTLRRDAASKATVLERYITNIASAAKRVFLIYPVPETGINVAKLNVAHWEKTGNILQEIMMPVEDYDNRNAFVNKVFNTIAISNVIKVRTRDIFCTHQKRCIVQQGGIAWYLDDDHLSDLGAENLLADIEAAMFDH